MRDVAIVSFAQCNAAREDRNEVEILLPVVKEAVAASKMERGEIGFTCSGSSDFLQGQPFAFVMGALLPPAATFVPEVFFQARKPLNSGSFTS